ncbi:type I methionyl aminopeptidase [Leptospira gomenensis]|uniref:Methionine aminopeptidase n=1 Tax=Leptospira gomenensis TaxID=2484974 RepID=A0A5F1YS76_9LEPT|nr:type I methionyl aminopeptidase [Leptospira gomenensis]TGK36029.1 type I methionyl aminopeptidase [Leptospira gomenensis]TGK44439.1 type I methionyl aminopeptidase [Leptospira gomenensis]TGK53368.1 type I methionyl aminopeptidase [Leptospira gomenensis]TGK60698.1 type I methionyl aminopeptidase [Leptospira gomenensis]
MSIETEKDLVGLKKIGRIVGLVLKEMKAFAKPGMSTKELDDFGFHLLAKYGAKSAPKITYNFPGTTCISVNREIAHGIPSSKKILKAGDLVNIDVSAELDGYFGDNGSSFVLGVGHPVFDSLVNCSRTSLYKGLAAAKSGNRISDIGKAIHQEAKSHGFTVIKNLMGHGTGGSLHEAPKYIPCYEDKKYSQKLKSGMVLAIETFISTKSEIAIETSDGWTLVTSDGSYVAQQEHTIVVTENEPILLTASNGV